MAPRPHAPVTAVVGAGPAGLLFCLVAKLRWAQVSDGVVGWDIYLFDKRDSYARTHRLRIDPAPFHELQTDLGCEPFDRLVAFLDQRDFRPEVNDLEATLASLVHETGIERELAVIGGGDGELDIPALRQKLVAEGRLDPAAPLSVVAADSVHSATRELVGGGAHAVDRIHHVVARLRVTGPGLPRRLGHLERFKLAKILGSALDYRLNSNGFGEVDLFLDPAEHVAVEQLKATPSHPVSVRSDTITDAPFFSAVVRNLEDGLGTGPCDVAVQSTFRLEHRYHTKVVFPLPDINTTVCLVGDAALSLPFFRGVAALTACAHALAYVHAEWANATLRSDARQNSHFDEYERQVEQICSREIRVVEARGKLVGTARELVRLSSVMPFPIQQWFLSTTPPDRGRGRMTPGAAANLMLAILAGIVGLAAPLVGGLVWAPLGWLWLAAVPLQFIGGGAYQIAATIESGTNPLLGRIWRIQIAALLLAGVPITLFTSAIEGRVAQIFGAIGWFLLGLVFAAGLMVSERVQGRRMTQAALHDF